MDKCAKVVETMEEEEKGRGELSTCLWMMMIMMIVSPFGHLGCGRLLQECEMYSHQSRMFSHTPPLLRSPDILVKGRKHTVVCQ
jgi:hypothetical protein